MVDTNPIERGLRDVVGRLADAAPPTLATATRYALFPGGARLRPRLCLAVASAASPLGRPPTPQAMAMATAIELLHCASLVHDDLPCFDNASLRRGRPSVHVAFGEAMAVLVGDGLIVAAFETVARTLTQAPERGAPLLALLAEAAGGARGLVAGQAWETEPEPLLERYHLERYHQAKTASLFVAASAGGALAAGAPAEPWRRVGIHLGAAYQLADDLLDAHAGCAEAGKSVGVDDAHQRPSGVAALGTRRTLEQLEAHIAAAERSVPSCPGDMQVRRLVRHAALRLVPRRLRAEPATPSPSPSAPRSEAHSG